MKKIFIAAAILVVLVVIVLIAVSQKKTVGDNVYVAGVSRGDIVVEVTGTGVVQARTKVNISSEIYGQIVELPVKEGQVVAKGALLVRIDPEKYRNERERLAANVRVSNTAIESETANLKNYELELRRAAQLYSQGILSSADKEKADLAVETSRIRIRSLKEEVSQAEAALSRAQTDLTKTTIYAPMAGKVTQVNTEVGEQVIVGTTNIPGSVIMVISDMSEVLAEVSVDETEIVRLAPGQSAKVSVDAVEKTTYAGRVTEIRNTAKKEGDVNVFGVKVLLTTPDERLRPGMTAKARIEVERRENVLRVPIQAVTTRERKKLDEEMKGGAKTASSGPSRAAGKADEGKASGASGEGAGGPGGSPSASPVADKKKPVPAESKRNAPDGKTMDGDRDEIEVVYAVDGNKVHAVPVTTGVSDETYVEIKDGVKEGESVVKGPYRVLRRLKVGDRVVKKDESEMNDAASGGESSSKEEID